MGNVIYTIYSSVYQLQYVLNLVCRQQIADNNINKQQKFYSLPERYNKFEQRPFIGNQPLVKCYRLFW